jgi:hypothetical protein
MRRPPRRAGSATVECIYRPTGQASLAVRVVNAENNAPLANADVWIEDPNGPEIILRTDVEGMVTIDNITPGEYAIEARFDRRHRFGVFETVPTERTTVVEIELELLPYLTFDGASLC